MDNNQYTYRYPHPAVTTDCVIFSFDGIDLKVLLIQRGNEPYKGYWAFPGGFLKMDENAEEGALRELREETGLTPNHIEQFYTFTDVNRDPRERVISIAFIALVKTSSVIGGDDACDAQWFKIKDIPRLAFDHDYIFRIAQRTLKERIYFESIGFDLLGETFTIPELQRLYEAILEVKFDRRNFQKKILQMNILEEVDYEDSFLDSEVVGGLVRKNIHKLFISNALNNIVDEDTLYDTRSIQQEGGWDPDTSSNRGRKAKKYKFNRERYEQMKDGGKFKLEF